MLQMIRVLHSVNSMNRGGLETFIMNVYRHIDREKVQFDFLVHTNKKNDFDEEIYELGGKIYNVPPRNKSLLVNRKALDNFFRTHNYKIIHHHSSSLSYIEPLIFAKKHNVPIRIIHGHSTKEGGKFIHSFIHRWHQLFINSYATHFFSCSSQVEKWMYGKKIKLVDKNKVKIINNGISTRNYSYSEVVRNKIRNELNIKDKFVIGHVGRFSYPKNHIFLLEVFKEVCKLEPNSILLLVGDGELRQKVEDKINELNLNDKVILTGKRNDVSVFLQAMDVFIFPSIYEGLPVTLIEAQSVGLPCLTSSNVSNEVKITDNLFFIDLASPVSTWVDKVMEIKMSYVRTNKSDDVIKAGYDIEQISNYLQKFYITNFKPE